MNNTTILEATRLAECHQFYAADTDISGIGVQILPER
jgi:hypothetical protein